jgi:lauroyl/myristoyl acyltransferase
MWIRYLDWGARYIPIYLEPIIVLGYTLAFYLAARQPREAMARNLCVLHPGTSYWVNQLRVFRIFWCFAWTLCESARARQHPQRICWQFTGLASLESEFENPAGLIVLTAHMGNYDLAAPVFAGKFPRKLHSVRIPEKLACTQDYMERTRDTMQSSIYQIHYNKAENLLGIELTRLLSQGEIVGIQGDRVMASVSLAHIPYHGHQWRLPKGPFVLSLASRCRMVPLFILRRGWYSYEVRVLPPLETPANFRDRTAALNSLMTQWSAALASIVETHWDQWFVMEDAFESAAPSEKVTGVKASTE